jgi:hypothetical protein
MENKFSEVDVTWASIEKKIPYTTVEWRVRSNGIPVYTFFDANNSKIDINECIVPLKNVKESG